MKTILLLSYFAGICISVGMSNRNVEPMYLDYLFSHGRQEEAYELLGVTDPNTTLVPNTNYGRYNPALYQGDILFSKEQLESARQTSDFNKYPSMRWDDTVSYYISPDYSASHRQLILRAIALFNSYFPNCLQWIPWQPSHTDYVYIYPGEGCNSALGRSGGQQVMNLQPSGCMDVGTVMHEMGHACGTHHEHQRSDRDNYIKVLYDNLRPEWRRWWNKEMDMVISGDYEIMSIMHYDMYNSGVTIDPWARTFEILHNPESYNESAIGRVQEYTAIDKLKLKRMYGCA